MFDCAVSAVVASDPEVAFDPLHDPDAVQVVVLVEVQERVAILPGVTVERFDEIETVGAFGVAGGVYGGVLVFVPPPPPVTYPIAT